MFKPHIGKCVYPGCTRERAPIVVKAGWCDKCNYNHKKEKKPPIKRGLVFKKQITGEAELFRQIWEESDKRCYVCKKPILFPTASNFMHVLAKALNKYPLFKLKKENIVLGCHDSESSCHHRYDKAPRSTLTEPMWLPLFELEEKLKKEYADFKNEIKYSITKK